MKKSQQEYRVGIGATSMLMIFIVLCLTTLAVLSLSSARIDLAMTRRNDQMITEYYGAVNRAQQVFAQLDAQLSQAQAAADEDAFAAMLHSLSADDVELLRAEDDLFSFELDAGFERVLMIEFRVAPYGAAGARYIVERHAVVNEGEWESDDEITLFW